jgi:hypothetical protein
MQKPQPGCPSAAFGPTAKLSGSGASTVRCFVKLSIQLVTFTARLPLDHTPEKRRNRGVADKYYVVSNNHRGSELFGSLQTCIDDNGPLAERRHHFAAAII